MNHKKIIIYLNLKEFFKNVEKIAITIACLTLNFKEFLEIDKSRIAIVCIIISIKRKMNNEFEIEQRHFINDFIKSLVKKFNIEKQFINDFYCKLFRYYKFYKSSQMKLSL